MKLKLKGKSFLLIISILISFICTRLPLLQIFDYEYAVVFSFVNYFLSAIAGFLFVRGQSSPSKTKWNRALWLMLMIVLNLIPVAISFLNTFLFGVCDPYRGFSYFLVFAIPASLIGFTTALFSNYQSGKYKFLIFTIISFIMLTIPIVEIYLLPQIYFYNPILTFFPGTIYDEDIPISFNIVVYKTIIVIFFSILLYIIIIKPVQFKKKYITLGVYFVAIIFVLIKSELGFQTKFDKIIQSLGGKYESKNFVIVYPKEIDALEIDYLIKLHEYELQNLKNQMDIRINSKITSIIFRNREEKRKIFGAGQADVSKPWLNQIYSELGTVDRVIKHELVHILSSEFGVGIFKLSKNFNPSLIEGLAMAFENNYNDYDIDYLAYQLIKSNSNPPLEYLFAGFDFFSHSSSVAYIYSGSFMNYLRRIYGNEKIKLLYQTMDFEKIYKKNLSQLEKGFIKNLEAQDYKFNSSQAMLYFGRQPIFKKVCLRQTAILLKEAQERKNDNDFRSAKAIYLQLFKKTHNINSLIGYVEIILKQKKYSDAEKIVSKEIERYSENSSYYYLKFWLADIKVLCGKFDEAALIYNELKNKHLSFNYEAYIKFRLSLLNSNPNSVREFLSKTKFRNELLIDIAKKMNQSEVVDVQILQAEESDEIYKITKAYFEEGFDVESVKSAETAFYASKLFLKNAEYNLAEDLIKKALNFAPENKKQNYLEQLLRINWFKYQSENKSRLNDSSYSKN